MRIAIFGLSVTSAWGNGHATLLRGLFRALHGLGHTIDFFERDVPYYAAHRDMPSTPHARIHLYTSWAEIENEAKSVLANADAAIVTSYCPDGRVAAEHVFDVSVPLTVFYDMDTPVTLSRLDRGEDIEYLPERGLSGFDQVLSYTGGEALDRLRTSLGARCVAPLYGWVDSDRYQRVESRAEYHADLSYLGTFSADRQAALDRLLIEPARHLPGQQFLVAGALHPDATGWPTNVRLLDHVSPADHMAFYSSARMTLNVTRGSMAAMGFCPSGRLFEAGACGSPILSDWWPGLDEFFEPGQEILIANSTAESVAALTKEVGELSAIARRARARTLDCHTAEQRARRLIDLIERPRDESSAMENRISVAGGQS